MIPNTSKRAKLLSATLLAVALLFVAVQSSARAANFIMAAVTAELLNVRATPSPDSEIIAKLSKNAVVIVTEVRGEWASISFQNQSTQKFEKGWASAHFLTVLPGSGGGSTYSNAYGAEFNLSVSSTDIDCDESYNGGYDECEVEISVSLESNYNGFNDPTVNISCDAEVMTYKDGYRSSAESGTGHASIYGRDGYATLYIDIDVRSYSNPVTRVKLDDVDCRIDDVY